MDARGKGAAAWKRWLAVVICLLSVVFLLLSWEFFGQTVVHFLHGRSWRVLVEFRDEKALQAFEDRAGRLAREIPFEWARRSGGVLVLVPREEAMARALAHRIRSIGDPGIVRVDCYKGRY